MACACGCPDPTCLLADAPVTIATAGDCDTIGLDFVDGDTVDWSLNTDGALTATSIISPDDGNVLELRDNGLYVPRLSYSVREGRVEWTENRVDLTPRQTLTLNIPEGRWFIFAKWQARIEKVTTEFSEVDAKFVYRLVIEEENQPVREFGWGQASGVLGHIPAGTENPRNSVAVGDSGGENVITEGRNTPVQVSIETSRRPQGPDQNVLVEGSFLSVLAVWRGVV